jgi:hypothetical protein
MGSGGFLEGEDILPGFRYPIASLFKEWDWEQARLSVHNLVSAMASKCSK